MHASSGFAGEGVSPTSGVGFQSGIRFESAQFRFDSQTAPALDAAMKQKVHRRSILTLATACMLVGCMAEPPSPAALNGVETVPLHVLARTINNYRGRTVRTCGRELTPITQANGDIRSWELRAVDPTSPHAFTAYVIIPACNGRRPRLDESCAIGRIAREDGSLDPPEDIAIGSHMIGSQEWWLHPQCPAHGPTSREPE